MLLSGACLLNEQQRQLASSGARVISVAAHPGYSTTDLTRNMPTLLRAGSRLAMTCRCGMRGDELRWS